MEYVMKRFILSLVLLAGAAGIVGSAQALDKCYSGSYYDPTASGSGIDIQVSDERIVLFRFGYLGSYNIWWTSVAANDGNLIFDLMQTIGSEGSNTNHEVGTLTLTPWADNNTRLIMDWNITLDLTKEVSGIPWCLTSGCSGSKEMVALFRPTRCE